jgi:hypothetical protein
MTDDGAEAVSRRLADLDARLDRLREAVEHAFGVPEDCVTVRDRLAALESREGVRASGV